MIFDLVMEMPQGLTPDGVLLYHIYQSFVGIITAFLLVWLFFWIFKQTMRLISKLHKSAKQSAIGRKNARYIDNEQSY